MFAVVMIGALANLTSCHPKELAINNQILVAAKYHTSL
jgi:hypothetical protein